MIAFIRDRFSLNEETGVVSYITAHGKLSPKLTKNACGYVAIVFTFKMRQYSSYAHRIAWILLHGAFPPDGYEIDHRDRDRANNRPGNLRLATRSQNLANSDTRKGKYKGVCSREGCTTKPWRASIAAPDGSVQGLGYFATEEDAARAYDRAARERYGEFAFLNFP